MPDTPQPPPSMAASLTLVLGMLVTLAGLLLAMVIPLAYFGVSGGCELLGAILLAVSWRLTVKAKKRG